MLIGGATTVKDSIVKHMFEKVVIKNNFKLTYRGTEKEESVPLSHSCSMVRGGARTGLGLCPCMRGGHSWPSLPPKVTLSQCQLGTHGITGR